MTAAGEARLQYLVAQSLEPNETTRGGVVRPKTKKRRQIEAAVVEEVVRFAFDHGGYGQEHLAPGGLYMELARRCGAIS